jgi:uncharacterized membrane protein YgcG
MLQLTQLAGFGAQALAPDVTPNAITIGDLSAAGFVATALTTAVTISGINAPITLRFAVSTPMALARTLTVFRNGTPVLIGDSGNIVDVTVTNGQVLQAELANALDLTTWAGTVSLINLSDASTNLSTFAFSLQDTGSGGGGGGGGGGGQVP